MSEVDRIRAKIERVVPDENERVAALRVLAFAVENADDERPNGWYLRETSRGLSLFAGRLFACGIQRRLSIPSGRFVHLFARCTQSVSATQQQRSWRLPSQRRSVKSSIARFGLAPLEATP